MKKISLFLAVLILLFMLSSCGDKNKETAEYHTNVKSFTFDSFVSDGKYLISDYSFLATNKKGSGKYNLETGLVTYVCIDETCGHGSSCPLDGLYMYKFIRDGKLYYIRDYDIRKVEGVDIDGPILSHPDLVERHIVFASYNLMTGEYDELINITLTEFESLSNIIRDGDYVYYMRNMPLKADAKIVDDYIYSMCKMHLDTKEETVLFTYEECNKINVKQSLMFVENDIAYFLDQSTGFMWRVNLDGSNIINLIDGQNNYLASSGNCGIFLLDKYIYYYVRENDIRSDAEKGLGYTYRISVDGGTAQRIIDEYIKWFYVTDDCIYYEPNIAYEENPENDTLDLYPDTHTIKRAAHNGDNPQVAIIVDKKMAIADAFVVKDKLFLHGGYVQPNKMDMIIVAVDLKDKSYDILGEDTGE